MNRLVSLVSLDLGLVFRAPSVKLVGPPFLFRAKSIESQLIPEKNSRRHTTTRRGERAMYFILYDYKFYFDGSTPVQLRVVIAAVYFFLQ